jgi:single-strand DNA-binding protein
LEAATSLPCRNQTIGVNKNIFINNLNLHAMNTLKNRVQLIGNVGNDPEIKTLEGGKKLASLSIATNESYTNDKGEKVEQTEWHRIEMWEGLANIAEQYLKKGDMAYIEGRIRTEKWTDKEGIERNTVKIRGNSLQLIGSGRGAGSDGEGAAPAYAVNSGSSNNYAPKAASVPMPPPPDLAGGNSDDLPF